MKKRFVLLFCWMSLVLCSSLSAQIELPEFLRVKMEQMNLDFYQPVENQFKTLSVVNNDMQPYDFALRHKKAKVDIRYQIVPDSGMIAGGYPHIEFTTRAIHLANNEDDEASSTISIHQISETDLNQKYHADWGAIAFFKPKLSFAPFQHCKLVALYREGAGYCYTFYLFNKAATDLEVVYDLMKFRERIQPQ